MAWSRGVKDDANFFQYQFVLDENGQVVEEIGFDELTRKYTRDAGGRVVRVDALVSY